MRRYGFADEAARVADALLDAAEAFGNQLPEVFAGFRRDEARMPVEYPGALKPQSWAAAAPLQLVRTVLGLEVVNGKLRSKPCLPRAVERLRLRGVRAHGTLQDAPSR
jgi:glycogen debranching enzyme